MTEPVNPLKLEQQLSLRKFEIEIKSMTREQLETSFLQLLALGMRKDNAVESYIRTLAQGESVEFRKII